MALLPSSFEENARVVHDMLDEKLGEGEGGKYVVQNEGLREQLLHMALFADTARLDKVVAIGNTRR